MATPPKWTDVYPHGTKEGDEEMDFFNSLARSKWKWRSTAAIVKETGLSAERVEQILSKYMKWSPPLVFKSETQEDQWAYWQRVPELVTKKSSIGQTDIDDRINRHLDAFASQVLIVQDDNQLP